MGLCPTRTDDIVPDGQLFVRLPSLQTKDYVKPGDSLSIGFDSALKLSSYNSTSYVEKPHGKLPDGTTFPQQVLLDGKAKQIQGKVTNSGHKKGA